MTLYVHKRHNMIGLQVSWIHHKMNTIFGLFTLHLLQTPYAKQNRHYITSVKFSIAKKSTVYPTLTIFLFQKYYLVYEDQPQCIIFILVKFKVCLKNTSFILIFLSELHGVYLFYRFAFWLVCLSLLHRTEKRLYRDISHKIFNNFLKTTFKTFKTNKQYSKLMVQMLHFN